MKEQFLFGLLISPEFLDPAFFFGEVAGAQRMGMADGLPDFHDNDLGNDLGPFNQ